MLTMYVIQGYLDGFKRETSMKKGGKNQHKFFGVDFEFDDKINAIYPSVHPTMWERS